ncbi:hypothetical protein [Agaribacterium haliotis]|uniref:hypothetical protein n=1 Tax=Agaribacterium haliotis TaxID=2013869 RepID=UPI000BB53410|nr:hypothetical protein [Agaribacterium haliotis]
MFNKLLKWSVLIAIWRRYGGIIKTVPLVLIVLVLIWTMHSDFLAYVNVSDERSYVLQSFLLKWGLILAVVYFYWRYCQRLLQPSDPKTAARSKYRNNDQKQHSSNSSAAANQAQSDESASAVDAGADKNDPFASIRAKPKLDRKADKVLKNKR